MSIQRTRRLRLHATSRHAMQEVSLEARHLIKPLFVHEAGTDKLLSDLPNSYLFSLKGILNQVELLMGLGIKGVNLYPSLLPHQKNPQGSEAVNPEGIIPKAIKAIKKEFPECLVIPDIALDPYTSHAHDGLIDENGLLLNDESVQILCQQSILYAQAGADILAPSDMCDGRTYYIRQALDKSGFLYTGIIGYAAKYASAYYNPFRGALGNSALQQIDKRSYQLEVPNRRQALEEIEMDLQEGADIIMIKPAGHFLDIVTSTRQLTHKPIAVFQVSGECAVIKSAAEAGILDEKRAVLEQLYSMRRAGADLIFSYYADFAFS